MIARFVAGSMVTMLALASSATPIQERPTPPVPVPQAPQYFAVIVADLDKSAAWYMASFGLRQVDRSASANGISEILNLTNDHLFVELIRDSRVTVTSRARGFAKVGFRVPDVDAVAENVAKSGERPQAFDFERHGVRILQIRDPDGNIIQLSSPLAAGR